MRHPLTVTVVVLALSSVASAQEVYRSTDEQGNVTFSDSRPAEAAESIERVEVKPQTPASDEQGAKTRAQEMQEAADALAADRAKAEAERAQGLGTAEAHLSAARKALEEAKVQRDEDWQHLAGGGKRLKESYHQRVQAAEAQVRQAEKDLAKARQQSR